MNKNKRLAGRKIRRFIGMIAKLDLAWRLDGMREGRLENKLAFELGNAYRARLIDKARQAQRRNAARLGQRSGWEKN